MIGVQEKTDLRAGDGVVARWAMASTMSRSWKTASPPFGPLSDGAYMKRATKETLASICSETKAGRVTAYKSTYLSTCYRSRHYSGQIEKGRNLESGRGSVPFFIGNDHLNRVNSLK